MLWCAGIYGSFRPSTDDASLIAFGGEVGGDSAILVLSAVCLRWFKSRNRVRALIQTLSNQTSTWSQWALLYNVFRHIYEAARTEPPIFGVTFEPKYCISFPASALPRHRDLSHGRK